MHRATQIIKKKVLNQKVLQKNSFFLRWTLYIVNISRWFHKEILISFEICSNSIKVKLDVCRIKSAWTMNHSLWQGSTGCQIRRPTGPNWSEILKKYWSSSGPVPDILIFIGHGPVRSESSIFYWFWSGSNFVLVLVRSYDQDQTARSGSSRFGAWIPGLWYLFQAVLFSMRPKRVFRVFVEHSFKNIFRIGVIFWVILIW